MGLEELAVLDPLRHLLRLLAVDRAVLELDPRKSLLARLRDGVLAPEVLLSDELVLDPGLVERFLHLPAGVRALHEEVLAAVKLDCHRGELSRVRRASRRRSRRARRRSEPTPCPCRRSPATRRR